MGLGAKAQSAEAVELTQVQLDSRTIRMTAEPTPVPVNGDAQRLLQALTNLLTNAIKYAPDSEFIDVRLRKADGQAELEVQDYGPGIPEADRSQIFTRFYQVGGQEDRDSSGMGLGLFIADQIVRAHGGTITAQSAEGDGTIFTIRLPLMAT